MIMIGYTLINFQKTKRRQTASWLRERVLQLGPTFIKLGQLSSTRSDLFPQEFVDELSKLQVWRYLMNSSFMIAYAFSSDFGFNIMAYNSG